MDINLNNRKFKLHSNTNNGEVSTDTFFTYHQKEDLIWGQYQGGSIIMGSLMGKVVNGHLEFVYQHINQDHEIMTGNCRSYPEVEDNGKIKLKEHWQWTCGDRSSGKSILIEI